MEGRSYPHHWCPNNDPHEAHEWYRQESYSTVVCDGVKSGTVALAADECIVSTVNGRTVCTRAHERHDPTFWPNGVAQVLAS